MILWLMTSLCNIIRFFCINLIFYAMFWQIWYFWRIDLDLSLNRGRRSIIISKGHPSWNRHGVARRYGKGQVGQLSDVSVLPPQRDAHPPPEGGPSTPSGLAIGRETTDAAGSTTHSAPLAPPAPEGHGARWKTWTPTVSTVTCTTA